MTGPVLILCPTSVIRNWENEFSEWAEFSVAVYHGPIRDLVFGKIETQGLEVECCKRTEPDGVICFLPCSYGVVEVELVLPDSPFASPTKEEASCADAVTAAAARNGSSSSPRHVPCGFTVPFRTRVFHHPRPAPLQLLLLLSGAQVFSWA
uniref:SNF2 N-terminal domain-containing protein n=1 Tax=Zea mays TaxID=4577 RepID=A0A804N0M6_MAIZE